MNIVKSLFETWSNRLNNPFIGSFVSSLVLINWRPLLFLLKSEKPIEDQISIATHEYLHYENYLVYPFLIAGFYTLALPWLMLGLDKLVNKANSGRIDLRNLNHLADLDFKIKCAKKEAEIEDIRVDFKDKEALRKTIENLQSELDQTYDKIDNTLIDYDKSPQEKYFEEKRRSIYNEYNQDKQEFLKILTKSVDENENISTNKMFNFLEKKGAILVRPSGNYILTKFGKYLRDHSEELPF